MKKSFIFSVLLITVISFSVSHAAASPRMQMIAEHPELKPGEVTNIDLRISDISPVYGAEMLLTFNPDVLEVISDNPDSGNMEIQPGDFFDLNQQHFPLQNRADNKAGRVYYAMSMLNPAPEASGEGVLIRVPFRAKAVGDAGLSVEKIRFGTREGKGITPEVSTAQPLTVISGEKNPLRFLIASVFLILIAGLGLIFRKGRNRM